MPLAFADGVVNQQVGSCRNVMRSHVIMTNIIVVWFLLSPTTSFVSYHHHPCPSLKRCGPHSKMCLNASQTTWTPVPPATALTLRSVTSLDVERQEHLPLSATALLSATSLDAEHWGRLPLSATALARSALPHHPTLSIEDAPGPLPSSLPHHLMLGVKDTSPGLPLPSCLLSSPVLPCHPTSSVEDASGLPPPFSLPHLALRMPPTASHCPIKSPTTPRNTP